jgi:DNA-binding transcriptional ArsR family regulator
LQLAKGRLTRLTVTRVTIGLSLVLIVVGCFAAQTYQQKLFSYGYTQQSAHRLQLYLSIGSLKAAPLDPFSMLAFSPSTTMQTSTQSVFDNTTRAEIYNYIDENPGIQFRAICSELCLSVGLVQYYLAALTKAGLVSYVRDGKYKRFFVSKRFSKREMAAISLLRHKTIKKIVQVLLRKKELSHCRLACEVSITSQALTWQMNSLRSTKFILQVNDGLKTIYYLDKSSASLLQKYLAVV